MMNSKKSCLHQKLGRTQIRVPKSLICCHNCGYAYYGRAINLKAGKNKERHYAYYRCTGTDAHRFGGERICDNLQVRTDLLDLAVCNIVGGVRTRLLSNTRIR